LGVDVADDKKSLGTVVCTSTHAVDLDTGRTLSPGETADGIDLDHPHNRGLVVDGSLVVLEGKTPRARQEQRLVDEAQRTGEENS
jgi:hypothetical protein